MEAAEAYDRFRAAIETEGKTIGTLDALIAAHAISTNAVLVTSDKAFYQVNHLLSLEDWTLE